MGYFFTNTLDITTSSLSLDYINPKNKKRLDFIMKLHKDGLSNKQIVKLLKSKGIKRRNKNDFYSVKDVWVCIDKMKKRVDREKKVKYSLGNWILNLDIENILQRELTLKIIKYSLNVFILLTLLSCSEDTNEVKNKILLNGNSVGLSEDNFEKLNNLLINVNPKNCNSTKLNDFFKGLDQSFDKNNFTLKFTDSENYEKTIKFQKPNCMNQKMKKL